MSQLSKFKIDSISKEKLLSLFDEHYDYKNKPDYINLLLSSGSDPTDGSPYFPMPGYETVEHLPFGDEFIIGQTVQFEELRISMTQRFLSEIDQGVICMVNNLVRVLPIIDFDERYLLEGIYI